MVIVPLVALVKDQVASALLAQGMTAASVKAISEGKYSPIFGSPEALLNTHRSIIMALALYQ